MDGQGLFYTTIALAAIVTIVSLKFLPSLKACMNTAKAHVKKTLDKDDAKIDIHSNSSAVTGILQLDIKYAMALSEGIQMKIQSSLEVAALKVQTKCLSQFKYSFALCSLY